MRSAIWRGKKKKINTFFVNVIFYLCTMYFLYNTHRNIYTLELFTQSLT